MTFPIETCPTSSGQTPTTSSDGFVVETSGLHVQFGRVRAIDDLSMRVAGGTICDICLVRESGDFEPLPNCLLQTAPCFI